LQEGVRRARGIGAGHRLDQLMPSRHRVPVVVPVGQSHNPSALALPVECLDAVEEGGARWSHGKPQRRPVRPPTSPASAADEASSVSFFRCERPMRCDLKNCMVSRHRLDQLAGDIPGADRERMVGIVLVVDPKPG
jgi:hypothetical protein